MNDVINNAIKVSNFFHEMNIVTIIFRIILSIIVGILIGVDRSEKRRVAGYKTHSVVCLGATIVMLTSQFIHIHYGGAGDVARLGAQVISGVGFLGVGTIIVTGSNQVKGLTTAASLWTCSCIGLAIGIGFYSGAIFGSIALYVIFKHLTRVNYYVIRHIRAIEVYLELESVEYIKSFLETVRVSGLKVSSFEIIQEKSGGKIIPILATIETTEQMDSVWVIKMLRAIDGVIAVEEYNC